MAFWGQFDGTDATVTITVSDSFRRLFLKRYTGKVWKSFFQGLETDDFSSKSLNHSRMVCP